MILNCSGRCDILAFFSEWLCRRVEEGYLDVRNPYNKNHVTRILIRPDLIDAICFCTKNPHPILPYLERLKDYPLIFQVTITPYGKEIEPGILDKSKVVEDVIALSNHLGKNHVIVRYDPILISPKYSVSYHEKAFSQLLSRLRGHIDTVIISFLDFKKNTKKHSKEMNVIPFTDELIYNLAERLSKIASAYEVSLQTCAEEYDLSIYGIKNIGCINPSLMEKVLGYRIEYKKGNLREGCPCIQTVDIGAYNCCPHFCKYCYANFEEDKVNQNYLLHDKSSSFLIGHEEEGDIITIKQEKKEQQITLPI